MSARAVFDLAYITRVLKTRHSLGHGTVLVLGSQTGGLFRSPFLYETLQPFSNQNLSPSSPHERFAEAYRVLLSPHNHFSDLDRDAILNNSLRRIEPDEADLSLARLVTFGLFDLIITTNVDSVLEDALTCVGLREPYDFEIFTAGSERDKNPVNSMRKVQCQILKVFGDLSARHYTMRRGGYFSHFRGLRTFLEEVLSRDILAIGLDPLWDIEFTGVFPLHGDVCWFLNERTPDEVEQITQIGNARFSLFLTGTNAAYHTFFPALAASFTGMASSGRVQKNRDEAPVASSSTTPTGKPLKLFLSYAPADERFLSPLLECLATLKIAGSVSEWYVHNILPGQIHQDEIDKHLYSADIILLLVSASFLAAKSIQEHELTTILRLQQTGRAHVIPLILRPVNWQDAPFGHLEPLPRDGQPITTWRDRDLAWLDVARGIRALIQAHS
jgi:hypothetical protein